MSYFIVYALSTGSIDIVDSSVEEGSEDAELTIAQLPDTAGCVFSESLVRIAEHWVDQGIIKEKTELELVVQDTVISNVPDNTYVTWPDGEVTVVRDGTIEIDSNVTGVFEVELIHAGHFPVQIEIHSNG